MSTEDPNGFDSIGFYDELGQPTYVELISVKRKTELAFKPPIRRNSVVSLPVEPQALPQAAPQSITPYVIGKSVIEATTKQMKAARVKQAKQELIQKQIIKTQLAKLSSPITIQTVPTSTSNLVQHLIIAIHVSGGTFTLTLDGQTTAAITIESSLFKLVRNPVESQPPFYDLRTDVLNALAADIESKLGALSNIGAGNVTVEYDAIDSGTLSFTITFVNDLASANILPLVPGSLALTFALVYTQDSAPAQGGFGFRDSVLPTNNGLGQTHSISDALAISPAIVGSSPGIYPINGAYAAPLTIGSDQYHTYPTSDEPGLSTLQLVGWKTNYSSVSVNSSNPSSNGYVRFSYGGNYTAPISIQSIYAWAGSSMSGVGSASPIYVELNKLSGLTGNILSITPNALFPMGENYSQYANLPSTGYFFYQNEIGFVISVKASAGASQIGIDTANIILDPVGTATGFAKTLRAGTTQSSAFDFTYVVAAATSGTYRIIFNCLNNLGHRAYGYHPAIGLTPTTYTTALAYNASAATIQSAIEAVPTIGAGNVTVTGSYADAVGIFNIKFIGKFLNSSGDPYTVDLVFDNDGTTPYGGPFTSSAQLWISGFDWSFGTYDHGTFNVGGSEIAWNASHSEVAAALVSTGIISAANGDAACDAMFNVIKSNASLVSPSAGEPPVQINSAYQNLNIIGGYAKPLQNLTFGVYGIGGHSIPIIPGPPVGGTFSFQITINGSPAKTVGPISFFASAADVKTAILSATGLNSSLIDVYKIHSGVWSIVFAVSLGTTPGGISAVDTTSLKSAPGWILDITAGDSLADTDFFIDTNALQIPYQQSLLQSQNKGYIQVQAESVTVVPPPIPTPEPPPAPCAFTNVALSLQWDQMQLDTTYLHHIYGLFLKVTVRDPDDPSIRTTVCLLPTGSTSLRGNTGKWWTVSNPPPSPATASGSQTNFHSMFIRGGYSPSAALLCQTAATLVTVGDATLPSNDYIYTNLNILQSPASGGIDTTLDKVRFTFPTFPEGEVESVGVYMLSRRVYEDGSSTFLDPEDQTLTATISYTRNGIQKNYSSTIIMDDLYSNLEDDDSETDKARWDEFPAISAGGPRTFTFDALSNAGLDQCTTHQLIARAGNGNLTMNAPGYITGYGNCVQGCGGSIATIVLNNASGQDEIQSVILPDRATNGAGGTWTLTFNGRTTENITVYASAAQVKAALEAIWGTEYPDNIIVTGLGTPQSPYIITFTQDLGRINWSQMTGSGANLTGSASVHVQVTQGGTANEIQRISRSGIAPGAKNEIQRVGYSFNNIANWYSGVDPTGTFTLSYNGETTAAISAIGVTDPTTDATNVRTALLNLNSLDVSPNDISVSVGSTSTVTGYTPRIWSLVVFKTDGTPFTAADTYTLTFNGHTTAPIKASDGISAAGIALWPFTNSLSGSYHYIDSFRRQSIGSDPDDPTDLGGPIFLGPSGDSNGFFSISSVTNRYTVGYIEIPANFASGSTQVPDLSINLSAGLTGFVATRVTSVELKTWTYYAEITFINRKAYTNVSSIISNSTNIVGPPVFNIVDSRRNESQLIYYNGDTGDITGGTFTLTFDGQTTAPITAFKPSGSGTPYLNEAYFYHTITQKLGDLSNIGRFTTEQHDIIPKVVVYPYNHSMYDTSADGNTRTQLFVIEFIGDMQQQDWPQITIDTSGLISSGSITQNNTTVITGTAGTPAFASGYNTTTQQGTPGNPPSFTLTLNGSTTSILVNNSSLAQVRAALELLPSIGEENIRVYTDSNPPPGDTDPIFGPWYLEFIGDLEEQNLAQTTVSPTSNYLAETLVQGGVGQYEVQTVTLQGATGGTFTLSYNGNTTGPIAWNASAAAVLSALSPIMGFTITVSGSNGGPWAVNFVGLPSSDASLLIGDGTNLTGGGILIATIRDGSFGGPEVQQVTVTHSVGGTFTLSYTNPLTDITRTTGLIPYNATSYQIQAALLALSGTQAHDFMVTGEPEGPWVITFSTRLGGVDPLVGDATNLLCVPIVLDVVPAGPYLYDIVPTPDLTPDDVIDPCCPVDGVMSEAANLASFFVYQRDLFDPNKVVNGSRLSIGQLAMTRGHNISDFTPYLRSGGRLIAASFSDVAESRTSIVLVENTIDSTNNRARILAHFAGHREILPMRML